MVASRIGGIQDQIEDGRSGRLIDARNLAAYGSAVCELVADPELAAVMGKHARRRVHDGFLGTRSLAQYIALFETLVTGDGVPAEVSAPSGYA